MFVTFSNIIRIISKILKMKKTDNIQITELFLIKADWGRTFMGSLKRNIVNGKEIVRGKVKVNDGNLLGVANNDDELMKNLDEICVMKLDKGLHNNPGVNIIVAETPLFLN
jgi:hypothetical protein